MSSSSPADQPDQVSDGRSAAQDIHQHQPRPQEAIPSPSPVEMSSLPPTSPTSGSQLSSTSFVKTTSAGSLLPPVAGPVRTDTSTAIDQSMHPPPAPPALADSQPVTRTFSTAIGPSSDSPVVPAKDSEATGPVLTLTLLLTSGARHPFRLDGKYLSKRNVNVVGNDPFQLSVYNLKELILREWREEWEAKPSSPNYIRLISMGKLLDDKTSLKGKPRYSFLTRPHLLEMNKY